MHPEPPSQPEVALGVGIQNDGRRLQRGCFGTFYVWLVALGGWVRLGKMGPVQRENWSWLATALVVLLGFIIPVAGLLQAWALKDYLDWKGQRGTKGTFFRCLIVLGCWSVGIVAGAMGVFAIAGAVHDGFSVNEVPALLFCCGLVMFGLLMITYPFRRTVNKTEREESAEWRAYLDQLASPDFVAIEQQSRQSLSEIYKTLYAAESPWVGKSWAITPPGSAEEDLCEISRLLPARPESLRRHALHSGSFLALAESAEEGDEFWILLNDNKHPVFLCTSVDQREPEIEPIADSLATFLSLPREET